MIGFLLKIVGNSVALYLAAQYVDGFTFTANIGMLAWAGVLITVGSYGKSILGIITFPLSIISLGVFSVILDFVLSALILVILAILLEPLTISGLSALLWGTVFIGLASSIISFFVKLIYGR